MDGRVLAVGATAKIGLAKVVRDFAGSRIEKQIVAQAVEIAWRVATARGGSGTSSRAIGKEDTIPGVVESLTEGVQA